MLSAPIYFLHLSHILVKLFKDTMTYTQEWSDDPGNHSLHEIRVKGILDIHLSKVSIL